MRMRNLLSLALLILGFGAVAWVQAAPQQVGDRGRQFVGGGVQEISFGPRLPGKVIASLPFTIDQCGRYYLARCLTGASGADGITINADDVTIDLNGFTLRGVPGSRSAITTPAPQRNISVTNGVVRDWGIHGVDLGNSDGCQLTDLRADHNGWDGLRLGDQGLVADSTVTRNNHITTGGAVTVADSCLVQRLTVDGGTGAGIVAGSGTSVLDCTVRNMDGAGIYLPGGQNLVQRCDVTSCGIAGISIAALGNADCRIVDNLVVDSGTGVRASGSGSHIQGNSLLNNSFRGLDVPGTANMACGNAAHGNGTNYVFGAGNTFGGVVNLVGSGSFGLPEPYANVEY